MPGNGLPKWVIDAHIRYRYLGAGRYMMAVPARDLTAADLIDVEEREGITQPMIEASGIYEAIRLIEVEPFCGAAECWEPVEWWGDRCGEHGSQDRADGHGSQDKADQDNNGFQNRTDEESD